MANIARFVASRFGWRGQRLAFLEGPGRPSLSPFRPEGTADASSDEDFEHALESRRGRLQESVRITLNIFHQRGFDSGDTDILAKVGKWAFGTRVMPCRHHALSSSDWTFHCAEHVVGEEPECRCVCQTADPGVASFRYGNLVFRSTFIVLPHVELTLLRGK